MHAMVCAQVGLLSRQTRLVRIKNVLTEQQDTVEVPTEETLLQVMQLSLLYSSARASSTQQHLGLPGGPDTHGAALTPQTVCCSTGSALDTEFSW
jgi:hypothetical protein